MTSNEPMKETYIFFYGHKITSSYPFSLACLSQWFPSSFTDPQYPEITFKTSEHYMMFQKSLMFDPSLCQQIIQSDHPAETKRIGRKIKNFNQKKWDEVNVGIVSKGNYLKFKQDDRLRKVLIDTGKARLVEASPTDKIWGIGFGMKEALDNKDKWGDNKLGVALERARRRLIAEEKMSQRSRMNPPTCPIPYPVEEEHK